MTDSNLQNTVPEGAFGIGSKKTDDFTENEKLRNFGIKDIPKALYEQLKKNSGAIVLPNQITEEVIQKAAKTQDEFLKPRSEEEATALRATAAGIVDIPNEIKHISDYLQGNPYDPNELIDLKALGLEKEGDMDNAAYQIFKFGSGFLIPYAGFNKALKGIKGIKALQGIKNYDKIATGARWFTAGGAADFVGVDAYDENLFNFLADIESPVVNNRFVRPIVEYLSAPERPEEGDESNFGEAKLKQFLTGTVFGETIGITGLAATKGLPKLKSVLEPYAIRLIDDVTGGPNILNPEQMANRTIQLLKDIKNDPTRLEFAKKQIARLKKATLVGSEEFSDEFTKVLDDLPKFDEIAPKTKPVIDIPDTRGQGKFYHGAASEINLVEGGEFGKAVENLYGDGFYVTEDLVTAAKYQKKNRVKGKKPSGVVYEVTEKQPVKFFDLDAPATPERIDQLRKIFDVDAYDEVDIIDRALDNVGSNASIAQIYDEIKLISNANDLSANTTADLFSSFTEELQREGFGGLTHQGGKKAGKGKRLHQVRIYFDPANSLNINKVNLGGSVKTKTKATDLPLQQSKPNPKIWGDVESITDDTWKATGKVLNRIVIPDDFSVEAASALGYDELLPKVIQIAKKISPNEPEKHMRVIYLGAIKEQKRLAKNVTQYMTDIEQAFMLGEDIPDELLQNWSEDVSRMINLAGPTKKISNETAGTVRVNQLIDAEPKDVARKTVDEEVGAGIGGGEKTADRATKEKFRTTTRDLVEKTKKEITEQKLIPTKEELYEGMQTYIKNNDIEGLLGITRKVLAMQGDSKRISKLVKGFGFGDAVGKTLRVSNELFINNLLSAPETQIINIVGSLFNVALGPLDLAAGSPILDKQMKIRAARELVSIFTSMKDSLTAAGKALWLDKNILDERRMFGTQDAYERYAIRMSGDSLFAKSINLFGHGIRVPSRFMMAGDEFIKQTAFRSFLMGELAEQATKKGLTGKSFKIYVDSNFKEITDIVNTRSFTRGQDTAFPDFVPNENILDSYTRALDYSADRTFTTELGKGFGIHGFGSKFNQDVAKILKSSALKPLVPFVTTPVNIGKQVLRRTGLPDLGTLVKGMPPKYNLTIGRILKEHNDNLLSEDLATAYRANGEATMGATIWAYFIGLAAQRNNPEAELALIGGGHHNKWLREGEKRTDELPYSFRVLQKDKDGNIIRGDNGLPNYEYLDILSRMEPIGSMLMIAGDMEYCNDFVSDEDYKNAAQCHIALLSRNLNNKYMIQNIAQMIDLTSDVNGLRRFYQVPVNYITNLVPYSSLWRSITRARGEEWYDELTKKTFKGRFPKRKTKFRKGDLFPQEERTEDRGDYTEDYEEFEGNDFGSLKLSNNPFKDIDTFSTMIMRNLQDQTSGFSADIEPIRSITTGRIAEYPEGAFYGDYFNPFKYKKEKDNPIDEYLKRIQFKVVPPSDVIPFDNEGNGINLDTNAYNKLTGLIPNIPINFKGRNPVFDPKNGKRFGEMILELSRDKTNIKALKYLESDDSGAIDAQATLKNKDKIRKELQKKVRDIYKVYKEVAIEYYKEFILDPELKKQAENETRRANEDIMRIINPIVND
tara:strand:- start:1693 stop:6462 length:4770 start_codon:yes stop_codon:yes gene_type:complete